MITAQSQNIPSDTSEDIWTRLKENIKESADETIGSWKGKNPGSHGLFRLRWLRWEKGDNEKW